MMFGGAARRGLYAERRTFIPLPSGERSFIPSSILVHPLVAFVLLTTCTRSIHAEGEPTNEISHLCSMRISRVLASHRYSLPFRHPCPVIQSLSPATSQQPPALLLLSDYCAAVTAVCRFVCIRVIHFLGNISSCAA